MAFGRVCELSVGSDGQGLLISDLDMEFEVNRSLTFAENTATFKIYNVKEETRKNILRVGNNVLFKVGYEDEAVGLIFAGNIREASSVKRGVNRETEIFAITGRGTTGELTSQYISLSFGAGSNLQQVITNLSRLYGFVVFGLENANIRLPNGWCYVGLLGGAFRYVEEILKANNKGIYRDNDEMVIYNLGENSKFDIITLTPTGGLLYVEDITNPESDKTTRLKFTSLIIPQVQVNGLVFIKNESYNSVFSVEKLHYTGNNFGGDYKMEGEVTA